MDDQKIPGSGDTAVCSICHLRCRQNKQFAQKETSPEWLGEISTGPHQRTEIFWGMCKSIIY